MLGALVTGHMPSAEGLLQVNLDTLQAEDNASNRQNPLSVVGVGSDLPNKALILPG